MGDKAPTATEGGLIFALSGGNNALFRQALTLALAPWTTGFWSGGKPFQDTHIHTHTHTKLKTRLDTNGAGLFVCWLVA